MPPERPVQVQGSTARFVRFPWEPDNPVRVEVLRLGEKVSKVRTIDPEPGCYAGEWAARTEWLAETP